MWSVHGSSPFPRLLDHLGKTHRMFSKMFHRLVCPDPIVSVTLGKARPCWGVSCVPRSVPLCFLPPEPRGAASASSSPLFSVSATFDSRSFLQAGAAIFPKCKLLNKIFCALERPHLWFVFIEASELPGQAASVWWLVGGWVCCENPSCHLGEHGQRDAKGARALGFHL